LRDLVLLQLADLRLVELRLGHVDVLAVRGCKLVGTRGEERWVRRRAAMRCDAADTETYLIV
jgi:hypothetical protein